MTNQPLIEKIKAYMKKTGGEIPLKKIYATFKDEKSTTIRGRINEAVKANKHIVRTAKGTYMLLGAELEAVVEKKDTKDALFDILKANIYYDLVFLDIPYKTGGQRGGNRNLSPYGTITPSEFQEILTQVEKMLRTEDSQIYFMIANGKSSVKDANKYIRAFDYTSLLKAAEGSYTKLNANGSQCNIGNYLIPPEKIMIFSPSGNLLKPEETVLDFSLQRPPLPRSGGYPTQKPLAMLEQIVKQGSNEGDKTLDLFAGSGEFLMASLLHNRKAHAIEISDEAIDKHILKRLETLGSYYNFIQEQREVFYQGGLFDYIDKTSKQLVFDFDKVEILKSLSEQSKQENTAAYIQKHLIQNNNVLDL